MSTASLFSVPLDRPMISFELYPPRTPKGEASLQRTVGELAAASPDFFSITYGASGSTRATSRELIRRILAETEVTPIAHLTCVGASEEDLGEVVGDLLDGGVRDFLALRGDPPEGQPDWRPHPNGLSRASELVELLRRIEAQRFGTDHRSDRRSPLSISVAAYPGGRHDVTGQPVVGVNDVAALLAKQEAGADFAITQLFFDVGNYTELVERARDAGVHIPILPGVIPLTDPSRLQRLSGLTGVPVPTDLLAHLESADTEAERYRRGLRASVDLLREVLDAGAPGLHVYTFNSSHAALDLLDGAGLRGAGARARASLDSPTIGKVDHV